MRFSSCWTPPLPSHFKLSTDVSHRHESDASTSLVVFRDEKGVWISNLIGHERGDSSFLAKALALFHGLSQAWTRGFRWVVCEAGYTGLVVAMEEVRLEKFLASRLGKLEASSGEIDRFLLDGFQEIAIELLAGLQILDYNN